MHGIPNFSTYHILESVKNGVVLPKGHGRLIDADDIDNITVVHNTKDILVRLEAPTVLEADKESVVLCDSCTHNAGAFSTHCNIDEDGPDPIYECDFYIKEVGPGR